MKGWPSGTAWLTAAAVVERVKAARRLADAYPGAADRVIELAFDNVAPGALAEQLAAAQGKEKVALALASPEYQLA